MQVAKWGNSLAIRIPAAVVEALSLAPGDEVEVRIEGGAQLCADAKAGARSSARAAARLPRPPSAGFRLRPGRGE